jgi:Methyltransferase FkbM domain
MQASTVINLPGSRQVTLPIISLDDAVASGDLLPPKVIKIDVEGAEGEVIAGATKTIVEHKPVIIFESFVKQAKEVECGRRELCEMILSLAPYRLLAVHDRDLTPFNGESFYTDDSFSDILAEPI